MSLTQSFIVRNCIIDTSGEREAEVEELDMVEEMAGPGKGGQPVHDVGDSVGVDDRRR